MQSYTLNRPDGALLCRVLEQHTNDAAGAILRLAWMAGLMRDEIQHLTWAQVDLLGEQLLLPDRAVPLAPELAAWLEALRRERNGSSERVVLSDRDQQPLAAQSISRLARAALDAGGPEGRPPDRPAPRLRSAAAGTSRLAVRLPDHRAGGRRHERPLRGLPDGEEGLHPHPPEGSAADRRVRPLEAAAGGTGHPRPGRPCGSPGSWGSRWRRSRRCGGTRWTCRRSGLSCRTGRSA